MRRLKIATYHVCRALGLFRLTSRMQSGKLLILCYHGFELEDETGFRPQLFISEARFRRRLELLAEYGINVLPLSEGLTRLYENRLPAHSAVITIDDGFASVHSVAMPLLKRHSLPSTLYVSTYYVTKGTPIFGLAVQYLFWKTKKREIDLGTLRGLDGGRVDISDEAARTALIARCIEHGETGLTEPERQALLADLGQLLDVDYAAIASSRKLSLASAAELEELQANGVDIQLHTHRHNFPQADRDAAAREIRENREVLNAVRPGEYVHFCYPSGQWRREHWPWLEAAGVVSATTCDVGLNDSTSPRYALGRFLDGENISEIEFRAEISGFAETIRRLRDLTRGLPGRRAA